MDLADCPPGTEGYEDTVIEIPKKKEIDESGSTKAEQEFKEHLTSLKIKLEDGTTRCMVERRGRDVSGKWIYLCFPCAAVCSGETILQTHISGKKHKSKLAIRHIWPLSIYDDHPYIKSEKGIGNNKEATEETIQKLATEVDLHNKETSDLDLKYMKYRNVTCHIQESLDKVIAPLLGIEYLIEFPPEEDHHEPSYMCILCSKQGHPRTIINHLTSFLHKHNYYSRHFLKAMMLMGPFKSKTIYREGIAMITNRLAQRIEDKYGRLKPICIEKDHYESEKEQIHQWIFKGLHFSEHIGPTFEEIVDIDLITSLAKSTTSSSGGYGDSGKREPSPPVVAAPVRPQFNSYTKPPGRNHRRPPSTESLSDISGDERMDDRRRQPPHYRDRPAPYRVSSREEFRNQNVPERYQDRYKIRNYEIPNTATKRKFPDKKSGNRSYKIKLANDKIVEAEESTRKTLKYHEKNPEKHPLYPEEWKKFWNRRYRELQTEGKDPSKYDFKPEWIVYWTGRIKELHKEELKSTITEIYRKLCLTPPHSPTRRSPSRRSDSRSPVSDRHRSRPPKQRRISPHSRKLRTRSRSPSTQLRKAYSSVVRPSEDLPSFQRSDSPLSRREKEMHEQRSGRRNHSPMSSNPPKPETDKPPALQTVLISDDELKGDNSPWRSDSLESLGSLPDVKSPIVKSHRHRSRSHSSRNSRRRRSSSRAIADVAPDNVITVLRLLVALENYLGSLGPKIVNLLTEALKMEKEVPNSSEELMKREMVIALLETVKEKLKGVIQAGLVSSSATQAVRNAIVKVASLVHEADRLAKLVQKSTKEEVPVSVAGVGSVDKAQIAQQIAAALVAQGKTDVSSEELAQLVDAVVGMAEVKKREAETTKVITPTPSPQVVIPTAKASPVVPAHVDTFVPAHVDTSVPSASALQLLQSAYDDDKKVDKPEALDAMDGLSDSDLETLLKNFNELLAEEQHSLIAYLKKLEAKEPKRVERLREYVSAAAMAAPPQPVKVKTPPPKVPYATKVPVTIESDDDDYTVEEVFKSATQKVKENQMRQEMEVVQKSLQQGTSSSKLESDKEQSSANLLLALVQASVQETSKSSVVSTSLPQLLNTKNQTNIQEQIKIRSPLISPMELEPGPNKPIPTVHDVQPQNGSVMKTLTNSQSGQINDGRFWDEKPIPVNQEIKPTTMNPDVRPMALRPEPRTMQMESRPLLGLSFQPNRDFRSMHDDLRPVHQDNISPLQRQIPMGSRPTHQENFPGETGHQIGRQPMQYDDLGRQPIQHDNMGRQPIQHDNMGRQSMQYNDMGRQPMQYDDLGRQPMQYDGLGRQPIEYDDYGQAYNKPEYEYQNESVHGMRNDMMSNQFHKNEFDPAFGGRQYDGQIGQNGPPGQGAFDHGGPLGSSAFGGHSAQIGLINHGGPVGHGAPPGLAGPGAPFVRGGPAGRGSPPGRGGPAVRGVSPGRGGSMGRGGPPNRGKPPGRGGASGRGGPSGISVRGSYY